MSRFPTLLRMEMARLRTPVTLAVPFLLLILTALMALMQAKIAQSFSVVQFFDSVVQPFILSFAGPLIGGGMLANDLKDHWARTTLMRPVTRMEFLLGRVVAVFVYTAVTLTINAWIPLVVPAFILNKPMVLDLGVVLLKFLLLFGQAYLLIVLMALLSCWFSGIMNVVMLAMWAVFSGIFGSYVRSQQWDNGFLTVAKDFVFPSGFIDAAGAVPAGGAEVWSGVLWGISAAAGFTAAAVWAFNRITIETGSE